MKKLKRTIPICFACLLLAFSVYAQENRSPVSIEQVESPGIEHNEALKRFGFFHNVAIAGPTDAIFDEITVEGNIGSITQYGSQNSSNLIQSGNSNIGKIIIGAPVNPVTGNTANVTQEGNELISIVNIQGNRNVLNFTQDGNSIGASINMLGNDAIIKAEQIPTATGSEFIFTKGSMPVFRIESSKANQQLIIE